ncbi:hypothetical protein JCM8097_009022 [Rhodosporidiobolus ruineniae]
MPTYKPSTGGLGPESGPKPPRKAKKRNNPPSLQHIQQDEARKRAAQQYNQHPSFSRSLPRGPATPLYAPPPMSSPTPARPTPGPSTLTHRPVFGPPPPHPFNPPLPPHPSQARPSPNVKKSTALKPLLPTELKTLPVILDPNWPGFPVRSLYLGTLDERGFQHFAVDREVRISCGLFRLNESKGKGKDVALSGYAFDHSPAIKLKFRAGSIARLYFAPVSEDEQGATDQERRVVLSQGGRADEVDLVNLVIETRYTPEFEAYYAAPSAFDTSTPARPKGSVRVTAFDKPHAKKAPFLSRFFLLTLQLPRDKSRNGQPSTRWSFADLQKEIKKATYLPEPVHLPNLALVNASDRYVDGKLKKLSNKFGELSPALAYHLEGILRDGTLFATELIKLISAHIEAWVVTPTVPYGDSLCEEILIELRTLLFEQRDLRARALKIPNITPLGVAADPDLKFDMAACAEEARERVVNQRAQAELEKKEKIEAGLHVKRDRKDQVKGEEHFWCRSIVFTPSRTIRVAGRVLEKSNALIRKYYHPVGYHAESDYFLRVDFREEDELRLSGARASGSGEAWDRLVDASVKSVIKKGLNFAGRKYDFLAYSQSGLREHTVYLVAPWPVEGDLCITAADVRRNLGDFEKVQQLPAMLGARYSQAFTSSYGTVLLGCEQINSLPDVNIVDTKGKEITNHTDGAGTMSLQLRDKIWEMLIAGGFRRDQDSLPPSVFQVRMGGSKGVIALDDQLPGEQICLRPSQDKFLAYVDDHEDETYCLNIADSFTRPNGLRLNRPLISALNDLGIDTKAFLYYQDLAVQELDPSELHTLPGAHHVLNRYTFGKATRFFSLITSLIELQVIPDRLLEEEPFLRAALDIVRARIMRDLKNKSNIPLPDCFNLVGVPDEDSLLEENQIYACLRYPDKPDQPVYLKGRFAMTRCPTVDPGDVRIVEAVGELPKNQRSRMKALENCVVLPTVGVRSLASMMGGGDLDGDTYAIITLPSLIPLDTVEPREHEKLPAKRLDHEATIDDVGDCFCDYLTSDLLGFIATQHLIAADSLPKHGLSTLCRQLADLHSHAVDAPKTGNLIERSSIPRPKHRRRPDFMRNVDGELPTSSETEYYESQRALGYLYRAIPEHELKTPSAVYAEEDTFANPSSLDSQSRTFRHVRRVVKLKLANLFDYTPDQLDAVAVAERERVRPLLKTLIASLNDLRITHTFPRSNGRELSEVEVFAVTSLIDVERHSAARGNVVAAMGRQTAILVHWFEDELRGDVPSDTMDVEALHLRYAAWVYAVDELGEMEEKGVRTARWLCLALLLESMKKEEKRRDELPPNVGAIPGSSSFSGPPPPPPPFPSQGLSPQGLPTPPSSPSLPRSTASSRISASTPIPPRVPRETRPSTSTALPFYPVPPLPSSSSALQLRSTSPPRTLRLPIRSRQPPPPPVPRAPVIDPTNADPWGIAEQRREHYGFEPFEHFNEPGETVESEPSEEEEQIEYPLLKHVVAAGEEDSSEEDEEEGYDAEEAATRAEGTQRWVSESRARSGFGKAEQHDGGVASSASLPPSQSSYGVVPSSPAQAAGESTYAQPSSSASAWPVASTSTYPGPSQSATLPSSSSSIQQPDLAHPQPRRYPNTPAAVLASGDDFATTASSAAAPAWGMLGSDEGASGAGEEERVPTGYGGAGGGGKGYGGEQYGYGFTAGRGYAHRPPTPPPKKRQYGGEKWWVNMTDKDKQRYKSNKTGLAKLGRLVESSDGRTFRDAYGLGRAMPSWREEQLRRQGKWDERDGYIGAATYYDAGGEWAERAGGGWGEGREGGTGWGGQLEEVSASGSIGGWGPTSTSPSSSLADYPSVTAAAAPAAVGSSSPYVVSPPPPAPPAQQSQQQERYPPLPRPGIPSSSSSSFPSLAQPISYAAAAAAASAGPSSRSQAAPRPTTDADAASAASADLDLGWDAAEASAAGRRGGRAGTNTSGRSGGWSVGSSGGAGGGGNSVPRSGGGRGRW